MVRWLNNRWLLVKLLVVAGCAFFAQTSGETPVYKDYKDPEQFDKFRKRRIIVAAWQIHKLKEEGAIVVKLKTNGILIRELLKSGKKNLAVEKQLEQFAINRNTMFAFKENFNFCKVYFIYSHHSDTLLDGCRQGIFLDTNLVEDPTISMPEKFYIISESDFAYSSSIGFVREDSARFVKEEGNPIKHMAIVLKNKYGHQLKSPMPYSVKENSFSGEGYPFPIKYRDDPAAGANSIVFPIRRTYFEDRKANPNLKLSLEGGGGFSVTSVKLKKESTYEKLSSAVSQLNANLEEAYQTYPKPDITRVRIEILPFLY